MKKLCKILSIALILALCMSCIPAFADAEVTGNLMVYTSAGDALISEICNRFNAMYPNAHVEYFRSGAEEVVSKLMAEHKAGNVQADIIMVSDTPTMEMLKANEMLIAYDSKEIDNICLDFVDADHMYYGTFPTAMGLCYNTNLAEKPLTSWKDLLEEFTKDNAIMPSPLYSGTACYAMMEITRVDDLGWDYYQGLCDNGIMVVNGNGGVINSVSAGEKTYGIVNESACFTAINNGSPLAFVYPDEGVPSTCDPVAILSNTQNIPAAQAFVDLMLSKDIQELGRDILGQTPIRTDVELGKGSMPLTERTLMINDPKVLMEGREADKEYFADMFGM